MAYATNTITTQHGLFGNVAAFFQELPARMQRRALYRQTVRELSALSDRELDDLGISRGTIHSISLEAAYGN